MIEKSAIGSNILKLESDRIMRLVRQSPDPQAAFLACRNLALSQVCHAVAEHFHLTASQLITEMKLAGKL